MVVNASTVSQLPLVVEWNFCVSFTEVETEARQAFPGSGSAQAL